MNPKLQIEGSSRATSDSWRRYGHEAEGAVAGAVAGGAMGAVAGPPGALAGAVIGGAIGAVVAMALEGESADRAARRKKLDAEVDIFRESFDAPMLLTVRHRTPGFSRPDRRGDERHSVCLPVYLELGASSPNISMTRDISATGALLLGRQVLPPGERVTLQIFILEHLMESHVATGRVVRSEPLDDDAVSLWSHRIAVQFEEPLMMREAEIWALAAVRERLHAERAA
jgi:hypothetical protein